MITQQRFQSWKGLAVCLFVFCLFFVVVVCFFWGGWCFFCVCVVFFVVVVVGEFVQTMALD